MTTRARVDRLARRLAAHVPTAAAGGVCGCPVERVHARIVLGDDDQLDDLDPCPTCGGMPLIVRIDLGADAGEILAARDADGGLHEISRIAISADDL